MPKSSGAVQQAVDGRSRRREIGVTSANRSCGARAAERQSVRQPWPQLGAKEFWRRRPSAFGRNSGPARRRSSRLFRRPLDSEPIAKGTDRGNRPEGAATPPLRSRRCGWALAATSADSAPRSSLGRLISRSRLRGSATVGLLAPDLGEHRRPSTNSYRVPAEIISTCGAVSAAKLSVAWRGGPVVEQADEADEGLSALGRRSTSRGRAARQMIEGLRAAPVVLLSTFTYGLRRLSAGRSTTVAAAWGEGALAAKTIGSRSQFWIHPTTIYSVVSVSAGF